jgi:hypothetical protein
MRRVLALPDFRLLWFSQAISTVGDRIVLVVLALYVNDVGTPTDVGIVLAAHGIPFVGLLLVGGVWADRLPRHLVMVWTDLVRAFLHGLLAVLILTGGVPIWAVAAIEAAFGAAEAFFRPAYTGLVPQTVPDELISEAQAVGFLTYNASGFIGPALGSALFLALGAGEAFAIDAATFVVSAVLLVRIRPRERGERAERAPMLSELRGGWTELRARPWALLVIASACWALLVSMAPFQALGPAIGDEVYDQAAVFGLVSAISGAGSIAGAILAVRWRPQRIIFVAMLVTMPWTGGYLAYALGAPLPLLGAIAFVGGFGIGLFMIWWESTLAHEIPPAALSRVSAFDWMGSLGLLPLGLLIAGPLGATVGLRETLIAGCVLTLVVDVLFAGTRAIREFRPARALERT